MLTHVACRCRSKPLWPLPPDVHLSPFSAGLKLSSWDRLSGFCSCSCPCSVVQDHVVEVFGRCWMC